MTIVDDNQWEPDEEFFLKLALLPKVRHIVSYFITYKAISSFHVTNYIT